MYVCGREREREREREEDEMERAESVRVGENMRMGERGKGFSYAVCVGWFWLCGKPHGTLINNGFI